MDWIEFGLLVVAIIHMVVAGCCDIFLDDDEKVIKHTVSATLFIILYSLGQSS